LNHSSSSDAGAVKRHFVIFNPAAGRGRGAKRIPAYRELISKRLPQAEFAYTSRPGDEGRLATEAVGLGFDCVVAVGGDGTLGPVANAVLAAGQPGVSLGVLPNGTGNDFCRNLGLHPRAMDEAVESLSRDRERWIDVGRIETPSTDEQGRRSDSFYFLNVVGLGFDVAVIRAAARKRFLKGEALYKVTAFEQLFRFPGLDAVLLDQRTEDWEAPGVPTGARHLPLTDGRMLMLTIANGTYFGGGFPISPGASVYDGSLHACAISDAGPLARLKLFTAAEKGRHVNSPRVLTARRCSFLISLREPAAFEADGEVRLSLTPEIRVGLRARALRVVSPMGDHGGSEQRSRDEDPSTHASVSVVP